MTFGASDMPLKPAELDKIGVIQFPTVMGGIVPVVNLDGIKQRRADDRRPDARQDLSRRDQEVERPGDQEAQPEREAAVAGDRARAPFGRLGHHLHLHQLSVEGQPGLEGRRSAATPRSNGRSASAPRATKASPTTSTQTKGAIGYVESAYAKQNKLTTTKMVNKDGKTVAATPDAIMAAAAGADWAKAPGFYVILTDQPGAKSWPIAGATFILMPKQPKDAAAAKEALKFFAWAYKNGGEMADEPRLRPDARQRRQPDPGQVEDRDQGRRRQAGLLIR